MDLGRLWPVGVRRVRLCLAESSANELADEDGDRIQQLFLGLGVQGQIVGESIVLLCVLGAGGDSKVAATCPLGGNRHRTAGSASRRHV